MAAVAIVGAGMAGLTAAYRLKQRGVRVAIYEQSDRVGGAVRTERRDGYLADLGPNSIAAPPPHFRALMAELGLESSILPAGAVARRRYIVRGGRLVPLPMSPVQMLTTPLLSPIAKLAVFREPFVRPGDALVEESIAGFIRRRFNQEIVEYVVNPFVAGVYAGDPEQLSVRHALPRLHALERSHGSIIRGVAGMRRSRSPEGGQRPDDSSTGGLVSFPGGLHELSAALADDVRSELRLGAVVTQVRRGANGWSIGAAFQTTEIYDGVVYTAPAHCLDEVDLDFPGGDRLKTLGSITYPAVAVLAFGFRREDVSHPLDGFGFLVPEVERRSVLGVLFSSSLFPGRAPDGHVTLTAFVGGARNPDLANADPSTIAARVLSDLRALIGVRGEPTFRAFHLWPKAIPQYDLTYGRFKEIMEDVERRNPGLALAGAFREGISLSEVVASGEAAAARVAGVMGTAAPAGST